MDEELRSEIRKYAIEFIKENVVVRDPLLIESDEDYFNEMDSLDYLELEMTLEEKFGYQVDTEKAIEAKTLDEYLDLVYQDLKVVG